MRKLEEYASGRTVLVFFIVTMSVYLWIVLYSIPAVLEESPDMILFDVSPMGYSHEYAKELLDSIGETGRRKYLLHQLPIDLIYPGLFAITYTLMLFWLGSKFSKRKSWLHTLSYVPFAPGILDYMENAGIFSMLIFYPELPPEVVFSASICTILKSLMTVLVYILLLYCYIGWGVKHIAQPVAEGNRPR